MRRPRASSRFVMRQARSARPIRTHCASSVGPIHLNKASRSGVRVAEYTQPLACCSAAAYARFQGSSVMSWVTPARSMTTRILSVAMPTTRPSSSMLDGAELSVVIDR